MESKKKKKRGYTKDFLTKLHMKACGRKQEKKTYAGGKTKQIVRVCVCVCCGISKNNFCWTINQTKKNSPSPFTNKQTNQRKKTQRLKYLRHRAQKIKRAKSQKHALAALLCLGEKSCACGVLKDLFYALVCLC